MKKKDKKKVMIISFLIIFILLIGTIYWIIISVPFNEIMSFLAYLNMAFITTLLTDFLLLTIFTKDWKFRWNRPKEYPQLIRYSKDWKVSWIYVLLTVLALPLVTTALWFFLPSILIGMGWHQLFVLFIFSPLVYLFSKLIVIRRKGISWWDAIPITLSVVSLVLLLLV